MSAAKPPRRHKATRRSPNPAPEEPRAEPAESNGADFAILGGPTADGEGAHLLRFREGTVSAGEIRPVREGEPITHRELVRLHPMDEDKRVCRVETLHEPPREIVEARQSNEPRRSRPARVSNDRYRKNWDAIFDNKKKRDYSVN